MKIKNAALVIIIIPVLFGGLYIAYLKFSAPKFFPTVPMNQNQQKNMDAENLVSRKIEQFRAEEENYRLTKNPNHDYFGNCVSKREVWAKEFEKVGASGFWCDEKNTLNTHDSPEWIIIFRLASNKSGEGYCSDSKGFSGMINLAYAIRYGNGSTPIEVYEYLNGFLPHTSCQDGF